MSLKGCDKGVALACCKPCQDIVLLFGKIVTNIAFGGDDGKTLFVTGLTAPMDGSKLRQCGNKACLKAGIYTTKLNVQGFPFQMLLYLIKVSS